MGGMPQPRLVIDSGGFQGAVITALEFSPDGRWLAVAGDVVRIWDLDSGKIVHTLYWASPGAGSSSASDLVFTPDGRRLLVSVTGTKASVHIYDTGNLDEIRELLGGHDGHIDKLAISHDGRWLVTAGVDQAVHVWDWAKRLRVRSFRFQQPLDYLGFPDNQSTCLAINTKGSYARINCDRQKLRQFAVFGKNIRQCRHLARQRNPPSLCIEFFP